jgi:hypothetical protein
VSSSRATVRLTIPSGITRSYAPPGSDVEEISADGPVGGRLVAEDDSDMRPARDEWRRPDRRRADTPGMFHARVLSLAVAPPARPARRPAVAGKPAAARRLSHWLGRRRAR